jgi:hypothetical protein
MEDITEDLLDIFPLCTFHTKSHADSPYIPQITVYRTVETPKDVPCQTLARSGEKVMAVACILHFHAFAPTEEMIEQ